MYCRKCIKDDKKINMDVNIEERLYSCPECGSIVEWEKGDEGAR